MRIRCCLLGLLAFVPLPAHAGGLAEVERILRKEPSYPAKPRYCLLVFGPEIQARVWLVRAGDRLYVDKNGNGDLTEPGECVQMERPSPRRFPIQSYASPEVEIVIGGHCWGKLQLTERRLHPQFKPLDENERETWQRFQRVEGGIETVIRISEFAPSSRGRDKPISAHIQQAAGWDATGQLAFAPQPKDAPIVHFDGPLTLRLADLKPPQWEKTSQSFDLQICLGTPGLGKGTFAILDFSYIENGRNTNVVPLDAYPVAEVAFPSKTRGGQPVHVRWVLKQRC